MASCDHAKGGILAVLTVPPAVSSSMAGTAADFTPDSGGSASGPTPMTAFADFSVGLFLIQLTETSVILPGSPQPAAHNTPLVSSPARFEPRSATICQRGARERTVRGHAHEEGA